MRTPAPGDNLTGLAETHFEQALERLRVRYPTWCFFLERDVVWTMQGLLRQSCPAGLRVFNDFPVKRGPRRGLSADLALVDASGRPILVAEFKYEPNHRRGSPGGDIWPTKLDPSVVIWGADGVGGDVERVRGFVRDGLIDVGYSLFIDEGRHFRGRSPHPGTEWVDWHYRDDPERVVSVLMGRFAGA